MRSSTRASSNRVHVLLMLVSALLSVMVIEGFPSSLSSYVTHHSTRSRVVARSKQQQPALYQDDDEDFLLLFQETSTAGIGLAREFNRQQQQHQVQLRKEQQMLEETFDLRPTDSAGFFNTGSSTSAIVSVQSSIPTNMKQQRSVPDIERNTMTNQDNWLLIFATSMVAQSSQGLFLQHEQNKDQQQQFLLTLTVLLLIASVSFAMSIPDLPAVVDLGSATASTTLFSASPGLSESSASFASSLAASW